jgi:hypothetical protein
VLRGGEEGSDTSICAVDEASEECVSKGFSSSSPSIDMRIKRRGTRGSYNLGCWYSLRFAVLTASVPVLGLHHFHTPGILLEFYSTSTRKVIQIV